MSILKKRIYVLGLLLIFGCNSSTSSNLEIETNQAANAMRTANKAGVDPNLTAKKEMDTTQALESQLARIDRFRKEGKISDRQALEAVQEATVEHKAALKKMRDSLYKEQYKPDFKDPL